MEIQEQNAQKHQNRAEQRVQEELDGRISLRGPPRCRSADTSNQHRFPENKEQEEIERHEDAEHSRLQQQKPYVIFLHPNLDGRPRRKNRDPTEQRGQHDQQERNASMPRL